MPAPRWKQASTEPRPKAVQRRSLRRRAHLYPPGGLIKRDERGFKRVWLGPLGELTWNATLRLYELPLFGRHAWWWKLRLAMWREFRGLALHRFGQRIQSHSPESMAYGETPLCSLQKMLRLSGLPPGSKLVDVGCGRGNLVLGAALMGYPSLGLEYIPEFVERSRRVADQLGLVDARFQACDFFETGLPDGDLYFLAATAYGERTRERLLDLLEEIPVSARIITLDWVLETQVFALERQAYLPVGWGVALASFYVRPSQAP